MEHSLYFSKSSSPSRVALSKPTIKELIGKGKIKIEPLSEHLLNPAGIDLRLGKLWRWDASLALSPISFHKERFALKPGEKVVGESLETILLPPNYSFMFFGKSSLERIGLDVSLSFSWLCKESGEVNGFHLFFVLHNVSFYPIILHRDMPIGQLVVFFPTHTIPSILPSLINLHLDDKIIRLKKPQELEIPPFLSGIDPYKPNPSLWKEERITSPLVLHPHEFVLASTVERVAIPNAFLGLLYTFYRNKGVFPHLVASLIHPGFEGTITLEIKNLFPFPIRLSTSEAIGRIIFLPLSAPSSYEGKYQHQVGVQLSKGL